MSRLRAWWSTARNMWMAPRFAFALGLGVGVCLAFLTNGGWLPISPVLAVLVGLFMFVAFMLGLLIGAVLSISEDQD